VPTHDKHGVRGSHTGIVTRADAACPEIFRHVCLPSFTHARVTAHDRELFPCHFVRSRPVRPAIRRFGRSRQVLAVAPGAARAFVVPAFAASRTDHDPILAQLTLSCPAHAVRQSRSAVRADPWCVPMRAWGTRCLGAGFPGLPGLPKAPNPERCLAPPGATGRPRKWPA